MADFTGTPMAKASVRFLGSYLLLGIVVTGCAIFSLWSAQPQVATREATSPDCSKITKPELVALYPKWVNVGSAVADFLILGCQFTAATQVKFNGTRHAALFVDSSHIRVVLTGADVASAGNLVITLSNGDADFGSGVVDVVPAAVYWTFFGSKPYLINLEVQLLLMVVFTGAFGACVYALKSLGDYQGDNKLYASWFTYYVIQPFEGAGIAFILYLAIRGGFLSGTSADVKTVNQFGMSAIAGLAGAFSDTAFLKLREVFQTLFRPQDDRGGKMTPPKIITNTLADGVVGIPYKQALQASGGVAPLKWSVTPNLPASLTLDAAAGTINGTPAAALPKTKFTFTVTDSATPPASSNADLTLEIKPAAPGLAITTNALPDGTANTPYPSTTLQTTGGTPPLKWSVTPALPASLTLDATAGTISGTPTVALPKTQFTFTVTDSASSAASSSVGLTLEIK